MYISLAVSVHELTHACASSLCLSYTLCMCGIWPASGLTFDNSDTSHCFSTAHHFVPNTDSNSRKTVQKESPNFFLFVALFCRPVGVHPRVPVRRTACRATSPAGMAVNWHSFWEGILLENSSPCQQQRLLPLIDTN